MTQAAPRCEGAPNSSCCPPRLPLPSGSIADSPLQSIEGGRPCQRAIAETFSRKPASASPPPALAPAPRRAGRPTTALVVGVIGPGGMGTQPPPQLLAGRKDVADRLRLRRRRRTAWPSAAKAVEKPAARRPKAVKDLRQVLDDKAVDAVLIATPDHWHAPAAILACDAGKHVYVEKPCCHNIREGRLMVEAARTRQARRAGRHAEPQHRRTSREAMQLLREGEHRRRPGGQGLEQPAARQHRQAASPATRRPTSTTTSGSARPRWCPYQPNLLPRHLALVVRLRHRRHRQRRRPRHRHRPLGPGRRRRTRRTVAGLGGKYFFDDDQQFPDTQYVVFEYPGDGKVGQQAAAHLRAAHLVALRAGRLRERQRLLRHQGHADPRQERRLEAVRPAQQADRDDDAAASDLPAHHHNFLDCIRSGEPAERRHRDRPPVGGAVPPGQHRHAASAGRCTSIRRRNRSSTTRRPTRWCGGSTATATGRCRRGCDGWRVWCRVSGTFAAFQRRQRFLTLRREAWERGKGCSNCITETFR